MSEEKDPPDPASAPESAPEQGAECTRRIALNAFLASGAVATAGYVGYPLAGFLLPPKEAEAAAASVVAGDKNGPFKASTFPVNSGKSFRMGSQPGLLVRLPDGEFRAFSAKCTHLSCLVAYRSDTKLIWCACHGGAYDAAGKNIAGPPPRPLTQFTANVNTKTDEIIVSRGA